jgi:hypothetical protein
MIDMTQDNSNSCSVKTITALADMSWLVSSERGYAFTMHPFGKQVYVIGNGYLCKLDVGLYTCATLNVLNATNIFIKTIEVTRDNYIFIGIYSQKMNELVPELYICQIVDGPTTNLVFHSPLMSTGEIPRGQATMTMSVHGSLNDPTEFALAIGIPDIDAVFLYVLTPDSTLSAKMHRSPLKGIRFGQSIIITQDRLYGVLAASLSTRPWSNSRIQVQFLPLMFTFSCN